MGGHMINHHQHTKFGIDNLRRSLILIFFKRIPMKCFECHVRVYVVRTPRCRRHIKRVPSYNLFSQSLMILCCSVWPTNAWNHFFGDVLQRLPPRKVKKFTCPWGNYAPWTLGAEIGPHRFPTRRQKKKESTECGESWMLKHMNFLYRIPAVLKH